MAKREDGFLDGAISKGLADFATRGNKKPRAPRGSTPLAGSPPARFLEQEKPAPKTDASGRRMSLLERMAAKRKARDAAAPLDETTAVDFQKRKQTVMSTATGLGHTLSKWHKRPGDRYGREDAHCTRCRDSVTVCATKPQDYGLPLVYGEAITRRCV